MKSLNNNLWNDINVEVMEDREEFSIGDTFALAVNDSIPTDTVPSCPVIKCRFVCYKAPCYKCIKL